MPSRRSEKRARIAHMLERAADAQQRGRPVFVCDTGAFHEFVQLNEERIRQRIESLTATIERLKRTRR